MQVDFTKYHGLGNDFLLLDGPPPSDPVAMWLCDRHRGIGADGVIAVDGQTMRVINADGSKPEMCGNGIRCAVLHLLRRGVRAPEGRMQLDTDAGPHECLVQEVDESGAGVATAASIRVRMAIPSLGNDAVHGRAPFPLRGEKVVLDGLELQLTGVSMGNPHLVVVGCPEARETALGEHLVQHPWFPEGINVGLCHVHPDRIALRVRERGAGFTQACGTGACAAAVAMVDAGHFPRGEPIPVDLPGGRLRIEVADPGEPCSMTGPAEAVFSGRVTVPGAAGADDA